MVAEERLGSGWEVEVEVKDVVGVGVGAGGRGHVGCAERAAGCTHGRFSVQW
jgi:hypothetical protein